MSENAICGVVLASRKKSDRRKHGREYGHACDCRLGSRVSSSAIQVHTFVVTAAGPASSLVCRFRTPEMGILRP